MKHLNYSCTVEGCERGVLAKGLCPAHYQSNRKKRSYEPCGVFGCERYAITRGLCSLHYSRLRTKGDPLASPLQTRVSTRQLPEGVTSPTELARLLGVTRQRAHQLLNPVAHTARQAVFQALADGDLSKPQFCERCGAETADLEGHHWNYSAPLDVCWLCVPCHKKLHVNEK